MDETEKLTGISTGGNSNHAVALHPADLEVNSSAEVKTTGLGGEVQGLDPGQRSIRRKLKCLERLACGFAHEEAATSSKPLIILGKGDLSVGAEQVPSLGPTMATQLALAGLRSNCGEWYENDARGGGGHLGNNSGYGEGQEGKYGIRSNDRERKWASGCRKGRH